MTGAQASGAADGERAVPDRPVALVGLMASGKSSVGRRLAARLAVPFVDSDREVERRAAMTVAEIFAADGEAGFRQREAAVLADVLEQPGARVVATGGGSVLDPATRERLRRRATVVWLRAAPAVLAARCRADGSRPLLADDPRAVLERLAAERGPLYAEVAHHVVDVDGGDRRVVLAAVLDAVAPAARAASDAAPGGDHPSAGRLHAVPPLPDAPPTDRPAEETPT